MNNFLFILLVVFGVGVFSFPLFWWDFGFSFDFVVVSLLMGFGCGLLFIVFFVVFGFVLDGTLGGV